MTYHGIVKNGKVELEQGTPLNDGTPVRIEAEESSWRADWETLARQVDEEWQDPRCALDLLRETRR